MLGEPPQLATPARLDEIGAATRRLERELDPAGPLPFAAALKSAQDAVAELQREVEAGYLRRRSRNLLRDGRRGGFFPFGGGDPEDLLGALREFAEKQAETVQDAQREQFATLTLNTAVELTAAALGQIQVDGPSDAQAIALRDAMRVLFPEAVALVSAARQGFMRQ